MIKKNTFVIFFLIIIDFFSCINKSEFDHSAAIVIKGREVKMTLYGPYYDVIYQWNEIEFVLSKISKNHSVKKVLIRLAPMKNPENEKYFSQYSLRKVVKYFKEKNIDYEIKDERAR